MSNCKKIRVYQFKICLPETLCNYNVIQVKILDLDMLRSLVGSQVSGYGWTR